MLIVNHSDKFVNKCVNVKKKSISRMIRWNSNPFEEYINN